MNIKTAKNIRIIDFLNTLGYQPRKIVRHSHFYLSPLRAEKTASMKVDNKLNLWYDHGSAQGGTIIDLILAMQKAGTVSDVAKIRKALSDMTYDGLWKIKYDNTGEAVFGFDVVHVRKGGTIEVVKFDPTK